MTDTSVPVLAAPNQWLKSSVTCTSPQLSLGGGQAVLAVLHTPPPLTDCFSGLLSGSVLF